MECHRREVLIHWDGATIDAVEVLMLDDVFSGDAMGRVVNECLLEQVHAGGVDVLHLSREVVLVPARESRLVVRQSGHTWPDFFCWRTENSEHTEELIDFGIALEQWLASCHLGKDTSDGPDINRARVALRSEQHLRGSVPESDDLVSVIAHGNAERPAQSEVSHLDDSFLVDQQVLWLQVAMQNPTTMAEQHCRGYLEHIAAHQLRVHHLLLRQRVHVLLKVHREELENKIKSVFFHQDVFKCDDVRMFQLLQQ